ncbi:MAG: chemoreceptor glutamine deamidase CheD [Gammaproteobacteria bacterium]|nr:chemoreceptor glutamine deamidase CheD [Gammaproteobacteria bacterium]
MLNEKGFSRRHDTQKSIDIVTIKMGGFYVTDKNETISTTLGSCIAVCIRDRNSGIGGMNHFLLPTYSSKEEQQWENTSVSAATRYGSYAMEYLINSILSKGGKRNFLEFKLFGGGNITGSFASVGKHNVQFIREYMETEGYGIAAESLGGSHPIIVNYNPRTGTAKIKRLAHMASEIATIERSFMQELKEKRIEGDVELF